MYTVGSHGAHVARGLVRRPRMDAPVRPHAGHGQRLWRRQQRIPSEIPVTVTPNQSAHPRPRFRLPTRRRRGSVPSGSGASSGTGGTSPDGGQQRLDRADDARRHPTVGVDDGRVRQLGGHWSHSSPSASWCSSARTSRRSCSSSNDAGASVATMTIRARGAGRGTKPRPAPGSGCAPIPLSRRSRDRRAPRSCRPGVAAAGDGRPFPPFRRGAGRGGAEG